MNGLLSMIGVVTRIDYQMDDFPFGSPSPRLGTPNGNIPSDKQKCQPKVSSLGSMMTKDVFSLLIQM